MKETDYAYAVAYTRTLENKMLSKADFEALLNAASYENALRILSDKGYGSGAKEQPFDAQALLKTELSTAWSEVKSACPQGAPIDILLIQNDFHNLKAILKAVFSGTDYQLLMLEPYTVSPEVIHHAVREGKPDSLSDMLKAPAKEAYQILARNEDGQLAEIVLDTALLNAMMKIAEQSKSDFLIGWVDLNIAIMNMKIALRGAYNGNSKAFLREAMLDCNRVNADLLADAAGDVPSVVQAFARSGFPDASNAAQASLGTFEKWCDNELLSYVGSARYKAFGFEPILAYLVGKQFELQSVRMILSGLMRGIPSGTLRERLRDLYD